MPTREHRKLPDHVQTAWPLTAVLGCCIVTARTLQGDGPRPVRAGSGRGTYRCARRTLAPGSWPASTVNVETMVRISRSLARAIPAASVRGIDGARHAVASDAPTNFVKVIAEAILHAKER